jgi:glycine cleavage system transcriptional repressor
MSHHLVISALGKDKPGIIDQLTSQFLECGCNIVDSRMTVLGGEFAILTLVDGNWNNIAKLESQIPSLEKRLDLTIIAKRTEPQAGRRDLLPYAVDVVALDQPGIVHNLASFFSKRNINIQDMITTSYSAAHTGTPMFSVHITVDIPSTFQISALREEFMDYCDQLNLDAVMEPVK